MIKEGDIILVHTKKGFIPKGIRFFTKCFYNHSAIVVKSMGELCILEATERGVLVTGTLNAYLKDTPKKRHILVLRPSSVNGGIDQVYERLKNIVGNPYDFKSLLYSQLINQLSIKYRWKGKTGPKAAKRMYCSEVCAYAYLSLFPEWWSVAPVDLYESKKLEEVLRM